MESTDTLSKGVSMSWPYTMYVQSWAESMESTDTLSHTMYVQG